MFRRSVSPVSMVLAAVWLAACAGDSTATDDGTTPTSYEPPEVVDTGWPSGDLANIHLAHQVNTGRTVAYAVFAESAPSFENLAQCAITGGTCIGGFASDEDDYEELDPDTELDPATIRTRFVGFELPLGPYTLQFREDPEDDFKFYVADVTAEGLTEGWIGPSWGGQWEEYEGDRDLYVSRPIELIRPATGGHIRFVNGEKIVMEWVPTGEGFLTLTVSTRFTLSRMYRIEDDGYFELDADSLGLTNDTEELTFKFTRWNQSQLRKFGHVIELVSTSEAFFTGDFVQVGARDQVFPADDCPEAQGMAPLQSGSWWGFLDSFENDLDPSNGCLGTSWEADARGRDAMMRMEIPPRTSVAVDYNTFEESASVYFVTDCDDANTCFEGADNEADPNVHEFVNYFNPSDETRVIYLVADTTDPGPTAFTADVTIDTLLPPDMYDTCAQAQAASPTLGSANYYADFVAYTNTLNPGAGGCTGTSLNGSESLTPITLAPGQTLAVNLNMPGGDPGLYLLYNCQNAFSCPVGADLSLGTNEQLVYTNQSAGTENLFLVVDSKTGLRPYFMGVTIF